MASASVVDVSSFQRFETVLGSSALMCMIIVLRYSSVNVSSRNSVAAEYAASPSGVVASAVPSKCSLVKPCRPPRAASSMRAFQWRSWAGLELENVLRRVDLPEASPVAEGAVAGAIWMPVAAKQAYVAASERR